MYEHCWKMITADDRAGAHTVTLDELVLAYERKTISRHDDDDDDDDWTRLLSDDTSNSSHRPESSSCRRFGSFVVVVVIVPTVQQELLEGILLLQRRTEQTLCDQHPVDDNGAIDERYVRTARCRS